MSIPEVKEKLNGNVEFFAVPAEEYGEIEFKNELINDNKISYGGGKSELIKTGAFEDIDVCIAHHIFSQDSSDDSDILLGDGSCNGFVSKTIEYFGKASHAAGAPEKGVNALNAASIGLSALAFQRETFKDEDHIRVHPIMTEGGDLVNVVPETVNIETLVSGTTLESIKDARSDDRLVGIEC